MLNNFFVLRLNKKVCQTNIKPKRLLVHIYLFEAETETSFSKTADFILLL